MEGKIILNLAMSLDGYIADEAGGYDWIVGQGDKTLDTPQQDDYQAFLEGIDIVVMGKNSYDQGFAKEYGAKQVYVAAHETEQDRDNIHFISGDVAGILEGEKAAGKRVYLFGGGLLLDNFLKKDAVDEYIVGIVPVVLGAGRPLFLGGSPRVDLKLNRYFVSDGIVIMHYTRR